MVLDLNFGFKKTDPTLSAVMMVDLTKVKINEIETTEYKNSHYWNQDDSSHYYDVILTGDLGIYGLDYLKEYLNKKYKIKSKNIMDAGVMLYNTTKESDFAGGSGPICAPLVLFTKIIKKYKKILVLGSGSLHSCMSTNLKKPMIGVSHAISLEVID